MHYCWENSEPSYTESYFGFGRILSSVSLVPRCRARGEPGNKARAVLVVQLLIFRGKFNRYEVSTSVVFIICIIQIAQCRIKQSICGCLYACNVCHKHISLLFTWPQYTYIHLHTSYLLLLVQRLLFNSTWLCSALESEHFKSMLSDLINKSH